MSGLVLDAWAMVVPKRVATAYDQRAESDAPRLWEMPQSLEVAGG